MLEDARHYRDWIFSLAAPYLGRRVLEFGAGSGTMLGCITDRELAVALEIDGDLVRILRERFGELSNVSIVHGNLTNPATAEAVRAERLDSAMTFNVLEHIEDDVAALDSIASVLEPGARWPCSCPPSRASTAPWTAVSGTCAATAARSSRPRCSRRGFSVLAARYVNLPGYFAWYVNGRLLRADSPAGGSPHGAHLRQDGGATPPAPSTRGVRPPCGQSLFVAGRRS